MTGPKISTGTLKAWVDKAAQGLSEFDEQLRSLLGKQPVVNFDETGLRIAERLGWMHWASTETLTRYTAHAKTRHRGDGRRGCAARIHRRGGA